MRRKIAATLGTVCLVALTTVGIGATPASAASVVEYGHTVQVVVNNACDWDMQVKWIRDTSNNFVEPRGIRMKQHTAGCITKQANSTVFDLYNRVSGAWYGQDQTNCNMPVGSSTTTWTECTFSGLNTTMVNSAAAQVDIGFYPQDNGGGVSVANYYNYNYL